MRLNALCLALCAAALSACSKEPRAPAPQPARDAAEAATEATLEWMEMIGVWAPPAGCGDATEEWRLEVDSFHLFETHCEIRRLELIESGVRAFSQCSVEGDDDGVEDVFRFERGEDATLSIKNEANESSTGGLALCQGEAL